MTHCIAFIHIGPSIPYYYQTALAQARLFNCCDIYLVADQEALESFTFDVDLQIKTVARESLAVNENHKKFLSLTHLDRGFRGGFWTYVVERFFVLESLIESRSLTNVVHLEGDNMLYVDLQKILPSIDTLYNSIAVPFDHDERAVAGFIYFKSHNAALEFSEFISTVFERNPGTQINDMQLLGLYRKLYGRDRIDSLPVVPSSYPIQHVNILGDVSMSPELYSNNVKDLAYIFDANALGQYIDGIDPRNNFGHNSTGFVNETAMYVFSCFHFVFKHDAEGRAVPFIKNESGEMPIANIHVHSKNLERFSSQQNTNHKHRHDVASISHPSLIPSDEIISSERLQAIADISIIDQHDFDFNTSVSADPKIKKMLLRGDRQKLFIDTPQQIAALQTANVIFVHTHLLETFIADILVHLTRPFVLMSHSSDHKITGKFVTLLDDPRVLHWFGQNAEISHPKLTPLPIGVANSQWPHGDIDSLREVAQLNIKKDDSAYLNLSLSTNAKHRQAVLDALAGRGFIQRGTPKPYKGYLLDLAKSGFCISPEGNGTDCHRTWEALYVGSFAMVDSSAWTKYFYDLPIISIDDWHSVTYDFLKSAKRDMQEKTLDFSKLTVSYWRNEILSKVRRTL